MDLTRRGETHHIAWRSFPAHRVASARLLSPCQMCCVYCIKGAPVRPNFATDSDRECSDMPSL